MEAVACDSFQLAARADSRPLAALRTGQLFRANDSGEGTVETTRQAKERWKSAGVGCPTSKLTEVNIGAKYQLHKTDLAAAMRSECPLTRICSLMLSGFDGVSKLT